MNQIEYNFDSKAPACVPTNTVVLTLILIALPNQIRTYFVATPCKLNKNKWSFMFIDVKGICYCVGRWFLLKYVNIVR